MGGRRRGGGGLLSWFTAENEGTGQPSTRRGRRLNLVFLALISLGGLQALLPALLSLWELASPAHTDLDLGNAEHRHDVFRSGQPWIVACADSGQGTPASFFDAARLAQRMRPNLNVPDLSRAPPPPRFGVLECRQPLPSGKSVYERFSLPEPRPDRNVGFTVANGGAPRSVPLQWFALNDHEGGVGAEDATRRKQAAENLLRYALDATRPFAVAQVASTRALQQQCLDAPRCGLVLNLGGGARLANSSQLELNKLAARFRTVRFAVVDAARLRLSLESALPPRDAGVSAAEPRLIFFRRRRRKEKGVSAKAHRGRFLETELAAFLEPLLSARGEGEGEGAGGDEAVPEAARMAPLPKLPVLEPRRGGGERRRAAPSPSPSSSPSPPPRQRNTPQRAARSPPPAPPTRRREPVGRRPDESEAAAVARGEGDDEEEKAEAEAEAREGDEGEVIDLDEADAAAAADDAGDESAQ
jgi:hypothetical protein